MSGLFTPKFAVDSPRMLDYFGIWMIQEEEFRKMTANVNGVNLSVHMSSNHVKQLSEQSPRREFDISAEGIATFVLSGAMMKAVPSMAEGSSYVQVRQQIAVARRDPNVRGAMLIMDTPGGTVKGNEDLVSEVAKFAASKPIIAFVEDLTASAGVAIASQATKIYANNETAFYGAIGTYAVIEDVSGVAEKLGVKVHVIKAGEHKGDGVPGTEVTDSQIAELQRIVDAVNENYLGLIASGLGRSVDSIREYADGRVIFAADAVKAGLVNGIKTLAEAQNELLGMVSGNNNRPIISRSMNTMEPATLKELKSTFPNSSAEWREEQQEAENDISQAAISYANHVEAKALAENEKHVKELEEAKKAVPTASTGHEPLTAMQDGGDIESGDAVEDFHNAVAARLPKNRTATYAERQNAMASVSRKNPGLHQAYIAATNKGARVQRLLKEKYETVS